MPNLTSFIKPTGNKKTSGEKNQHGKNHHHRQQNQSSRYLTVDGHHAGRSRDKSPNSSRRFSSPRLGFFWRPRPKNGNNSSLSKSGSQSRIVSASSSSLASSGGQGDVRIVSKGQIPKCVTVANFQQVSPTSVDRNLMPGKYSSVASFGPLRRGGSSLCASLASLGLSRAASAISKCSSHVSFVRSNQGNSFGNLVTAEEVAGLELCRLCLCDMPPCQMVELSKCGCKFCHYCLQQYIMFQIFDGNVKLTCPDAYCEKDGVLLQEEIESLTDQQLFERYQRYQLNYEVDIDPTRMWCPKAGCETICPLPAGETALPVHCQTCDFLFCSKCKLQWHSNQTCEAYARKRMKLPNAEEGLILNEDENASIKRCPLCRVPIERDEGCAQMMCKRCKHVFCWYCLASLDDDFLLRHYDKGPCKNKLGHTRASVFWHRTQVVGIFAGFGLLLLVASPFLLLVAPCIVYSGCKSGCKPPNGDEEDLAMTSSI